MTRVCSIEQSDVSFSSIFTSVLFHIFVWMTTAEKEQTSHGSRASIFKFTFFLKNFQTKFRNFKKRTSQKIGWFIQNYGLCISEKFQKNVLSPKAFVHVSDTCNDLSNPRVSTTKESQSCHALAISCERPWDYHQHYFEGHFRNAFEIFTSRGW